MKYRDPITGEFKEIYVRPAGDTLPLGGIIQWDDLIDIPANWLRCDGSVISRTEYINLFNIIGTTYGIGDGSTTFNLPNIPDSIIKFNNNIGLVGNVIDSINGTSTTDAVSQNQVKIINDKITANRSVIGNSSDTYSSSSTYALGDLVIYNNLLYKCTTAITVAEAWDNAKWTQVNLTSISSDINGKILWSNPSPTNTAFASQNINLNSNDYDKLEFIFDDGANEGNIFSVTTLKNKNVRGSNIFINSNEYISFFRQIDFINLTQYSVKDAYVYKSKTNEITLDNYFMIPLYVVGYKTGLFS